MPPPDLVQLSDKGQIVVWGDDTYQQISGRPPGKDFAKIVPGGAFFSLALRNNGTLALWGGVGAADQIPPPGAGDVYSDAAIGITLAIAIRRADGAIVTFGQFALGDSPAPPSELTGLYPTAIAVGGGHCLAIADFKIYKWGGPSSGTPPDGAFIMVSARNSYSLALREDGALFGWGGNLFPAIPQPPGVQAVLDTLPSVDLADWTKDNGHHVHPGPFVAIAAGGTQKDRGLQIPHVLALKPDGTVVGWGSDAHGEISKTPKHVKFKAIAAGLGFSLGLDESGHIHHWGDPGVMQVTASGSGGKGVGALANVPKGRFVSIGATTKHAAAVSATNVPSSKDP